MAYVRIKITVALFSLALLVGETLLRADQQAAQNVAANAFVIQKKKAAPDADEVEGWLKALDLQTGTLTLLPTFGKKGKTTGPETTYNLSSKELPVRLFSSYLELNQLCKLTELEAGDKVRVKLVGDDVIGVRIMAPILLGNLIEVNPKDQTVQLRLKGKVEKTLTLAPNARLLLNGQPAKLTDFTRELPVSMVVDLKQTTILSLHDGKSLNRLFKLLR